MIEFKSKIYLITEKKNKLNKWKKRKKNKTA